MWPFLPQWIKNISLSGRGRDDAFKKRLKPRNCDPSSSCHRQARPKSACVLNCRTNPFDSCTATMSAILLTHEVAPGWPAVLRVLLQFRTFADREFFWSDALIDGAEASFSERCRSS